MVVSQEATEEIFIYPEKRPTSFQRKQLIRHAAKSTTIIKKRFQNSKSYF